MASIYETTWRTKKGELRRAFRVGYYASGKKKFRQFSNKTKAHRFIETISEHQGKEKAEQHIARSLTIGELAELWFPACAVGIDGKEPLRDDTIDWYRGVYNAHLKADWGSTKLEALTKKGVREWRDRKLREGVSRTRVAKVMSVFSAMLGYGVVTDELTHNIVSDVAKPRRTDTKERIPKRKDVQRFLAAAARLADERPKWKVWRLMLEVLVYAGLRLSEVRGLRWCDVDLPEQCIKVEQRADKRNRMGPPKSKTSRRTIDIPSDLAIGLHELKAAQSPSEKDLVFPTRSGKAIDPNTVYRDFSAPLEEETGLLLDIHALRHFYASRLIEEGFNVKELQVAMGHSDPAFTLRVYGHLFQDRDAKSSRRKKVERLSLDVLQE